MNNVRLSDTHLQVINKALETYYRLRSGQIKIALDTAYGYTLDREKAVLAESVIRGALPEFEGLWPINSSYGVGAQELGDANIAYEINKTFQEYLSVKRNGGYYGYTVDFHGPLKVSKEPLPVVREHKSYKDFPLNRAQSEKVSQALEFCGTAGAWNAIRSFKLGLPSGDKQEIVLGVFEGEEAVYGGSNTQIIVRIHKPRKP